MVLSKIDRHVTVLVAGGHTSVLVTVARDQLVSRLVPRRSAPQFQGSHTGNLGPQNSRSFSRVILDI